ncbi:hypothetical protein [Streptomyces sp. NBC_00525]|uniref:hypothetical protein n=1 Tax=Streptomyces sp. NBC_00525 TaxID=2903660 RepID=UPI002E803E30|nr:hypothetical protein [Streptomyces sp. NBC_00525]WUC93807.1 hypothetical protein OG710_09420 [Streptomyces sp. NBC_00525]
MSSSDYDPDEEFGLVDQYDSFEDPWLRSEFLDAIGRTRPCIDALRARRDAARTEDTPGPVPPRRRRPGSRRAAPTRPRNRTDLRYPYRRRLPRTVVLVIVIGGLD